MVLLTIIISIISPRVSAQPGFGTQQLLNDNWLFLLKDEPGAANPGFDDKGWRKLDLPHDWSIEAPLSPTLASCTGYLPGGIGWYRRVINVSPELEGKRVFIYFDGVYNRSSVYINGQLLGYRPNGYVSFAYDLTPYLRYGEPNTLAVRVDHSKSADSRWYTGSGIYRNVYLVTCEPVHFDLWGVTYNTSGVTARSATVHVSAKIINESGTDANVNVRFQLADSTGKVVSGKMVSMKLAPGTSELSSDLRVKDPVLWSLDSPCLYRLNAVIYYGGKDIDESAFNAGIRTLKFDPDKGFALNGKWMKVKGVCIHHDAGVLGSAVPPQVLESRLKTLKTLGCNAIRMSHNLQAPELYDLCDKLGFLIMDEGFDEFEFPKKKWLEGWNVGEPGYQGSYDFFNEWSDRDIKAMVLRDRNHPSVFMWSIGNEVDYPNDPYTHPILSSSRFNQPVSGGYDPKRPGIERLVPIGKRLSGDVREIDTTRPVTGALAGVIMTNETEYPACLDVVGYNYTEDMYAIDHKRFPGRVIYGSENGHSYNAWKAVRDNDFIFGQFIWTGFDYLGESLPWPSRGFGSGLLDLAGFVKPLGYFRMAMWSEKPVTFLGTYLRPARSRRPLSDSALPFWNYSAGDTVRVVCYTNCRQSQLFLNGTSFGSPKDFDDNSGIVSWDVPFSPGRLEVVGLADGKEVARYSVETSGRSSAIVATPDKIKASAGNHLIQVTVGIVDQNGIPVMLADDEVTCIVTGPAKLLGMESASNTDTGDWHDNVQRVYHGRLLAYIRTTGQAGEVSVTFSAPWLKPAIVVFRVE